MSNTLKKMALSILLVASLSLVGFAADISGTWTMTIVTQQGDVDTEMTIEQDGEKITVMMVGMQGEEMVGEGTFKESKAEWSFTVSTPQGDFTISYTGILEEDALSGEVDLGDYGTMEWTAKKK